LFRLAVGESANFASLQCRVVSNLVTLVVEPRPIAKYGVLSPVICANEPVHFIDSTQSISTLTYEWDFGDGASAIEKDPYHIYSQSGTYNTSLIVTSAEGCADTAFKAISIQILPIPVAKFIVTPTDTTIFHPTITFIDESTGAVNCLIDWGDGTITDCLATRHDYTAHGTYLVKEIVENAAGCYDTAYAKVIITAEFRIFIPSAFTPNGDGMNDIYKPSLIGVHNYYFRVFNRWGEQVFMTENPTEGWDGTFKGNTCPPEIYVYKITFRDDVENKFQGASGTFLLIR
jgi:gliding motility-associated-like protein